MPVDASQEQIDAAKKAYGFDKPLPVQYLKWLGRVATGDLGRSIATRRAVILDVRDALANSLVSHYDLSPTTAKLVEGVLAQGQGHHLGAALCAIAGSLFFGLNFGGMNDACRRSTGRQFLCGMKGFSSWGCLFRSDKADSFLLRRGSQFKTLSRTRRVNGFGCRLYRGG